MWSLGHKLKLLRVAADYPETWDEYLDDYRNPSKLEAAYTRIGQYFPDFETSFIESSFTQLRSNIEKKIKFIEQQNGPDCVLEVLRHSQFYQDGKYLFAYFMKKRTKEPPEPLENVIPPDSSNQNTPELVQQPRPKVFQVVSKAIKPEEKCPPRCRICLNVTSGNYKSLKPSAHTLIDYAKMFTYCTGYNIVYELNYFPTFICCKCESELLDCYKFRNKCENSQEVLDKVYKCSGARQAKAIFENPHDFTNEVEELPSAEPVLIEEDGQDVQYVVQTEEDLDETDCIEEDGLTDVPWDNKIEATATYCENVEAQFSEYDETEFSEPKVEEEPEHRFISQRGEEQQLIDILQSPKHQPDEDPEMKYESETNAEMDENCYETEYIIEEENFDPGYSEQQADDQDQEMVMEETEAGSSVRSPKYILVDQQYDEENEIEVDTTVPPLGHEVLLLEKKTVEDLAECLVDAAKKAQVAAPIRNRVGMTTKAYYGQGSCTICKKKLSIRSMKKHLESHRNMGNNLNVLRDTSAASKRFTCSVCGNQFKFKVSLTHHMDHQHPVDGKKPEYQCKYCGRIFNVHGSWRHHIRMNHLDDKKHQCKQCEKRFISATKLKLHMSVHTQEQNHHCHICTKSFTRKSQLTTHINVTHSNVMKETCDVCHKEFKSKKYLRQHYVLHTGEKNYDCPVCTLEFAQNHVMRSHLSKMHPEYKLPPKGTITSKKALQRLAQEAAEKAKWLKVESE